MTPTPGHRRQISQWRFSQAAAARAVASSPTMSAMSMLALDSAAMARSLRRLHRFVAERVSLRVAKRLATANRKTRSSNGGRGNSATGTSRQSNVFGEGSANPDGFHPFTTAQAA